MDISVEELLLLENLTNIDSNFREAIGKDLDIASYKTVGQMLDQFTPEVMDTPAFHALPTRWILSSVSASSEPPAADTG